MMTSPWPVEKLLIERHLSPSFAITSDYQVEKFSPDHSTLARFRKRPYWMSANLEGVHTGIMRRIRVLPSLNKGVIVIDP
jgi:hypothetical protein